MDQYYTHLSIVKNDHSRYTANALNERVEVKFNEAKAYRQSFAATTWTRLKWSERIHSDHDGPLSPFSESSPKQIMQNVIMVDFYRSIPTMVLCLSEKLGARLASSLIAEMVEKQMVVKKDHEGDKRVKLLFPTIRMVQAYEEVSAKWEYMRVASESRLHESTLIKELVYFDTLRKKYLPDHIYKNVKFNLVDVMDDDALETINHPLLKIV